MLNIKNSNLYFSNFIKEYSVQVYFFFLFLVLFFIYLPSFFAPLRSDYLPLLYFFHHLDALPGKIKWLHILNYDPVNQVNFYPLTHVIIYLEYLVFGSCPFCYHLFHFGMYCVSLALIYKLARIFCPDRSLTIAFVTLFAFLFSHFDIIIWSYHIHIIISFCLLLTGFMLYLKFLKTGKTAILIWVIIAFLLPLFCYLPFVFWPLGIIILAWLKSPPDSVGLSKARKKASLLLVLGITYSLYIGVFFTTRTIGTYDGALVSLNKIFEPRQYFIAFFSVFFDTFYNGVLVNLMPFIAWPLKTCENIELGGWLNTQIPAIIRIIYIGGGLALLICLLVPVYFFRRKKYELSKASIFLFFLLFSEFFVLSRLSLLVNDPQYVLQQFRYQYIINVFVMIIVLLIVHQALGNSKLRLQIFRCGLALVLIMNIYYSLRGAAYVNSELAPLKKIVYSIKSKIDSGMINSENKIYIDDKITQVLPSLCWNDYMGTRFMKHTYQWMFTQKEVKYFTFSPQGAKWVIREEDFELVEN